MRVYCLDTNALIQPWTKYYSMIVCPSYWEILDRLAQDQIVFCTSEVGREIEKVDDGLYAWVKQRPYLIRDVDAQVMTHLRNILQDYPRLVDTRKSRSMADPWVIAHAIAEKAVVVTKEEPSNGKSNRVKIPDVCQHLGIRWINDYRFVEELGIRFTASLQ